MSGFYQDAPGWVTCWPPKEGAKTKAAFAGILRLEEKKYWCDVYVRKARNGTEYLAIHLQAHYYQPQPQEGAQPAQSTPPNAGQS